MTEDDFTVERTEPLSIECSAVTAGAELMSPYVWRLPDGRLGILVRVVGLGHGESTGTIWYGESNDGLVFRLGTGPVLAPDPDGDDAGGCEDPTVVVHDGELFVFYTGVDADGKNGRLLWAKGTHPQSLVKQGVALASVKGQENVKEAEFAVVNGHWTLGYEYACDEASSIGTAEGEGPSGPWLKTPHEFSTREGKFDSWHLSPGPLLLEDVEHPVMFYNGGTRDAEWAIGWVRFDHRRNEIIGRCQEPVIPPPGEEGGRNMAFAASLILVGEELHLYFTCNDRTPMRAVTSRNGRRIAGNLSPASRIEESS